MVDKNSSDRMNPQSSDSEIELSRLREINQRSFLGRISGYFSLTGPGWIQGAITLGAASATSAFYLGWRFGYQMLWVNILGMAMGVIMFSAIARPTLYKTESIYSSMGRYVHPSLAVAWAVGALLSSIAGCLNQYAVATACLADLTRVFGWIGETGMATSRWIFGLMILCVSIPLTWTYSRGGRKGFRLYERILKGIIFIMVFCFAVVALKTGIRWGALLEGLLPRSFPTDPTDRTVVLGALGCAVSINMTFLFPVTLRARGWTREHLGLARFDLFSGMLVPFSVISSLVVITTANILHGSPNPPEGPAEVARIMTPLFQGTWLPDITGRVLFDIGIAAMPLSTITVLMLISGLAFSELMKTHDRFWFKVGTLFPVVGVLGAEYSAPFWLGPLVASFALTLLPIAYIGFFTLCNSRKFMGDDMATSGSRWGWNVAMLVVVALSILGASAKVVDLIGSLL